MKRLIINKFVVLPHRAHNPRIRVSKGLFCFCQMNLNFTFLFAGVAQSVEQLIRNQQVVGSSPISSSSSSQATYRLRRAFSFSIKPYKIRTQSFFLDKFHMDGL